jgi:light-harvesting complex 1 beta chain
VVQVLPLQWRTWFPGAEGGQNLIGDVRSAVYTFMSYLT